jgi:hypothetical protein
MPLFASPSFHWHPRLIGITYYYIIINMLMRFDDGIYIDGYGFIPSRPKKTKEPKKKKPDSYFETLTVAQLKELCKASKIAVSGTKLDLVTRLMQNPKTVSLGQHKAGWELKEECKSRLLIVSGNKYDLLLRILHHDFETGTAKRAATETIIDDDGQEKEILKKRAKIIFKPNRIYEKVKNLIHAVNQKKYQTQYGSKDHTPDVFMLLRRLFQEHCIDSKIAETDPLTAFDMVKAAFQAFRDHWRTMERTGYGSSDCQYAMELAGQIFKIIRPHLSPVKIEEMVTLVEAVEVIVRSFYCFNNTYWDSDKMQHVPGSYFHDRVYTALMPNYNKENRQAKKGTSAKSADSPVHVLKTTTVIRKDGETTTTESTYPITGSDRIWCF